ncbi:hypothetical protein AMAG_13920 [Allomyces macrogynus ATCC 38327]|uniref:Peptidase S8/S53 domain-containing protein n=1 Tax=Allomyces macrogynus (strain ATCC 38327) TaxID=578462 RepID=A0A0L0T2I9_ALLM3|nr:hypothetical protein AMAG_13920 [Allomyces macrogynus ATCC 38327]|eukprot:KNE69048.1 hypothetical protein AMAG_13920 [Allomyces macrogynus ATCC 38327]
MATTNRGRSHARPSTWRTVLIPVALVATLVALACSVPAAIAADVANSAPVLAEDPNNPLALRRPLAEHLQKTGARPVVLPSTTLESGGDVRDQPVLINVILSTKAVSYGSSEADVRAQQQAFLDALKTSSIGYSLAGEPLTGLVNMVPLKLKRARDVGKVRKMSAFVKTVFPVTQVKLNDAISGQTAVGSGDAATPAGNEHVDLRRRALAPDQIAALMSPHTMTGVADAQRRGLTGKGVKIAIIDTGIDATHPALGGNCFHGNANGTKVPTPTSCLIASWDDLTGDNQPMPMDCGLDGHGSRVAGVVAARAVPKSPATNGTTSGGSPVSVISDWDAQDAAMATKFVGVAPGARLYVYRVYNCAGSATSTSLARALQNAVVRDKVDIINLSLGQADPWALGSVGLSLDTIAETSPNVHVVSVAGNDGQRPFNVAGPGSLHPILSVGSIDNRFVLTRLMKIGGRKSIDYLFSVTNPIVQADIAPSPVVVVSPFESTNSTACTDGALFETLVPPALRTNRTMVIYQGTCPGTSLELIASAAGAAGARSVILALTNNDLSSADGRGTMRTDAKWAKITARDAKALFVVDAVDPKSPLPRGVRTCSANIQISADDNLVRHTNAGQISAFSSFGPTALFDLKPEIVAVGGSILTTQPLTSGAWGINDGTSFAAPYLAGCIALILEARGKTTSMQDMRALLMRTAVPALERAVTGKGNQTAGSLLALPAQGQGAGLVSVKRALDALPVTGPGSDIALLPPGLFSDAPTTTGVSVAGGHIKMTVDASGTPTYAQTVTIRNVGKAATTFYIAHVPALAISATDSMIAAPATVQLSAAGQSTNATKSVIAVPVAGNTVLSMDVTIAPNAAAPGALFSGYLRVEPGDAVNDPHLQRAVYVPFAGYNGDLLHAPVFPANPNDALAFSLLPGGLTDEVPMPWTNGAQTVPTTPVVIPFQITGAGNTMRIAFQTIRPTRQLYVMVFQRVKRGAALRRRAVTTSTAVAVSTRAATTSMVPSRSTTTAAAPKTSSRVTTTIRAPVTISSTARASSTAMRSSTTTVRSVPAMTKQGITSVATKPAATTTKITPSTAKSTSSTAKTTSKASSTKSTTTTASASKTTSSTPTKSATKSTSSTKTASKTTSTKPTATPTPVAEYDEVYVGYLYKGEYLQGLASSVFWSQDTNQVMQWNADLEMEAPVTIDPTAQYRIKLVAWWGKDALSETDLAQRGRMLEGPVFQLA